MTLSNEHSSANAFAGMASSFLLSVGCSLLSGTFAPANDPRPIVNVPWVAPALVCYSIGIIGILVIWNKKQGDLLWVLHNLFLPLLLFSFGALVGIVVDIYKVKEYRWTGMAILAVCVEGFFSCIAILLIIWYQLYIIPTPHDEGIEAPFEYRISDATASAAKTEKKGVKDVVRFSVWSAWG